MDDMLSKELDLVHITTLSLSAPALTWGIISPLTTGQTRISPRASSVQVGTGMPSVALPKRS